MKSTIKMLLLIVIAASTIFADGDLGNGGYTGDGDLGNGGRTCTINCPVPTPSDQNSSGTSTQTNEETDEEDSILTTVEKYLDSLFG